PQPTLNQRPRLQPYIVCHYQPNTLLHQIPPDHNSLVMTGVIRIQHAQHTRCVQINQLTSHRSDTHRGLPPDPSTRSDTSQPAPQPDDTLLLSSRSPVQFARSCAHTPIYYTRSAQPHAAIPQNP